MSAADESEKDGREAREAAEDGLLEATPAPARVTDDAPDASDADATVAGRTATLGGRPADDTERRPPVAPTPAGPDAGADDPALRDVAGTMGRYLHGRAQAVRDALRAHRVAAVVAAVAVLVLLAVGVALALRPPEAPSEELVAEDARTRLTTPEYAPGAFGIDDILVARDVEVRSIAPSEDGVARAEVLVTYEGSNAVRAEKSATLGYALRDGEWVAAGEPEDVRVSWTPVNGISRERLAANMATVLERADQQLGGDGGGASLEELYEGAELTVEREEFDPEEGTDVLDLVCVRAGIFESYECRLTVTFSFRSSTGQWEIEGVRVSEDGRTRSLEPLVGTWSGTFSRQETDGTKCLAARAAGLAINVDQTWTEGGVTQVSGSVAGVAHYHAHPAQDAQGCDGDSLFQEVPFTATLVDDEDGTLVLEATLPEDVDGVVSLTLRLGSPDDPTAATAEVTTSFAHTGSFLFIPYDETLTYTDVFSLRK